jgi:hypothetical protein
VCSIGNDTVVTKINPYAKLTTYTVMFFS